MYETRIMENKKDREKDHVNVGWGLEHNEASRSEATKGESHQPTLNEKKTSQEVLEKPVRRKYSIEYKLKIVKEADRCREPGEIGALLRREGLYYSNLATWRKQIEKRALDGLKSRKRGPKKALSNPLSQEIKRLNKEKSRLEKRLKKAEAIIEFQKKIAEILEIPMKSPENEGED